MRSKTDTPRKEIYEDSKHGIAFFTAQMGGGRNATNILKDGKWVLGDDYHTAPICSTCYMGSFMNYRKICSCIWNSL